MSHRVDPGPCDLEVHVSRMIRERNVEYNQASTFSPLGNVMTRSRALQGSTLQAQYIAAYDPSSRDGANRKLLSDSREFTSHKYEALSTRSHFRKFVCFGFRTTPRLQTPRLR
jgi:hypothetical protein